MGPHSTVVRLVDDRTTSEVEPPRKYRGVRGSYARYAKPFVDRSLGLILFILALPPLAIIGLLVLVRMGRPVFFHHSRVGRGGAPFRLYKIRTMVPDRRRKQMPFDGLERRAVHKSENDPRVTPFGRRLRALRLDELPQLWNVLIGDMSLVGPRPELAEIVNSYEPWQHERHRARPGLTGLWQVSRQNGTPMHECTDIDIAYVRNISLRADLSILAVTPLAMLGRRGGY